MTPTQSTIDQAINTAVEQASTRGWEAIVLLLFMVGLMSLTGFIVKWLIRSMDARMQEAVARENRMAARLNELEAFVKTTLIGLINNTAATNAKLLDAIIGLTNELDKRPCLVDSRAKKQDRDTRLRTQLADSHTKAEE